jgi:hypothetical protein
MAEFSNGSETEQVDNGRARAHARVLFGSAFPEYGARGFSID